MSIVIDNLSCCESPKVSETQLYRPLVSSDYPIAAEDMIENQFGMYMLFGLPTWALVDGTWAVLSQLADTLPEGYNISAYLILCLTFGNLVPLIIGLSLYKYSTVALQNLIRIILIIGFITGLLMAFLWNQTVTVSSSDVSLPLYILFFTVGACSSSSNVTHYTHVSRSAAANTTALATGMGLGSMSAGILALLQGFVLINYGFNVMAYYLCLAMLYVPAMVSFSKLTSVVEDTIGHSIEADDTENPLSNNPTTSHDSVSAVAVELAKSAEENINHEEYGKQSSLSIANKQGATYDEMSFLKENAAILMLQLVNASLGYGLVPAMVSYACGKFRNPSLILLLATGIAAVVDPLFKGLTYYVRIHTFVGLQLATMCLVVLATGLVLCAGLPGNLSLYQTGAGGILPVCLYVGFGALFGFSNTCVFRYFKDNIDDSCVQHSFRWSGIASQTGALTGSLIAFFVVVTNSL